MSYLISDTWWNYRSIYFPEYSKYWNQHSVYYNIYRTWIHSITVLYNTLKRIHIILYYIWYQLHDEPTVLYIFQYTPSIDISMLYWNSSLQDVNSLYYSTVLNAYKNIVGSREKCSYNRYVLITDTFFNKNG